MVSLPILTVTATLLASLTSVVLASPEQKPFLPAQTPMPVRRYDAATPIHELFARQTDGCIAGTYSCSDQGSSFSGICCASGQACSLDSASSPACCPSGDVCTGTAPSSYRAPSSTAASYVSNQYFSFPYIATSFSNAAACSRAAEQCSANYQACTASLEGAAAAGGVTVVVGGSTTISANSGTGTGTTYATATATSICSSLSSVACFGIQTSYCTAGTTAGFSVGSANAAARPTVMPCVGVLAGVAAGVGFGMVGV